MGWAAETGEAREERGATRRRGIAVTRRGRPAGLALHNPGNHQELGAGGVSPGLGKEAWLRRNPGAGRQGLGAKMRRA